MIQAIVRFARLLDSGAVFEVEVDGTDRVLTYRLLDQSPTDRHGTDFAIAYCLHRVASWTGRPLVPRHVTLQYARPPDTQAYVALLGKDVSWGQPRTTLRFTEAQWRRPVERTDSELARVMQHVVELEIAELPAADDLRALVAGALLRQCQGQAPTLPKVARQMGMSTRSLQRRLAEEGTNFRALSLTIRLDYAVELLRAGELSLAEVGFAVGFAEVSAFHRAFRRAHGTTPAQLRDAKPSR